MQAKVLKNKINLKNNHGFTLIEILVAMILIIVVLYAFSGMNPFDSKNDLEDAVLDFKRAVRFIADESALRNTTTRIHIYMDKSPQEWSVEYGPSANFIQAPKKENETQTISKEEEEKLQKETKQINLKFQRVTEFMDENKEVSDNVKVVGLGNLQSDFLQTKGEVAIYSYPTGEKDQAILFLADDERLAAIKIDAFSNKITHNYYLLGTIEEKDIESKISQKTKEIFEKWLREKN